MNDWQPIDTAPTDEPVLISAWLENEQGGERFMDIARNVFGEWVDEHDGDPIWPPTHWMPLPLPPQ
jgi:hypothetical protein